MGPTDRHPTAASSRGRRWTLA